ncbi:hypothetical protein [Novilysobacter antarcticus]|uniref:hypothetical protein n=1 Tax=Novilysobacter antarcticus TaxID=2862543 RepID=UPI001C99E1B4
MSSKFNGSRNDGDTTPDTGIEAHADLRDGAGKLLGGIVRRDGEWVLGMDGKMVGSSDSAATMLALIRRAASMHERTGAIATLKFSDALRDAANAEARELGLEFQQFEAQLDEKMKSDPPSSVRGPTDRTGLH